MKYLFNNYFLVMKNFTIFSFKSLLKAKGLANAIALQT